MSGAAGSHWYGCRSLREDREGGRGATRVSSAARKRRRAALPGRGTLRASASVEKTLYAPAVEGPMVRRLADSVEGAVLVHEVTPTVTVVNLETQENKERRGVGKAQRESERKEHEKVAVR